MMAAPLDGSWVSIDLLALDNAWPLHDVLAKLIQATEHLLNDHSCDAHGYEEFRRAAIRGKEILDEIGLDTL